MLAYAAARDMLVNELRANAADHEAERYDTIGRRFDRLEHDFPVGTAPELARLHIALAFWDGWIDARNNGWPRGTIDMAQWPVLARRVADDLAADREIQDPLVRSRFDLVANPRLNERVQWLAKRLRNRDAPSAE